MFGLTRLEVTLALCVALAAAFGIWLWHHDHKIIAAHDARLEATSAALKAQAQQKIIDLTAKHTAEVAANQEKLDAQLKTNSALSDALDSRVRDFQAYRASHPSVASPPSGPPAKGSGECGAQSCGDLAQSALQDSDGLARSLGEVSAALHGSQRDRDSLTGLPK